MNKTQFSKKLFDQFYQNIVPVIEEKYSKKVQVCITFHWLFFILVYLVPPKTTHYPELPRSSSLTYLTEIKTQVIFRHQVQPWHPSSTLVHEAALAVGILAPHRFWEFSHVSFFPFLIFLITGGPEMTCLYFITVPLLAPSKVL